MLKRVLYTVVHCQLPYLIVTDLQMPHMSGLEFLAAVCSHPQLRHLIIYVLTTSNRGEDKDAAYAQHVAGYLLKAELDHHWPEFLRLLTFYQTLNEFPAQ